jgi:hypothetical protein
VSVGVSDSFFSRKSCCTIFEFASYCGAVPMSCILPVNRFSFVRCSSLSICAAQVAQSG